MRHTLRCSLLLFTGALAICLFNPAATSGQVVSQVQSTIDEPAVVKINSSTRPTAARTGDDKPKDEATRLSALEDALREQRAQLDELRKLMLEQQETIKLLSGKLAGTAVTSPEEIAATTKAATTSGSTTISAEPQTPTVEDRLKKVEGRISELGGIKFSGDIRLRSESFFGASNNLASGNSTTEFGNDLSPRHRMRIRARLAMRGTITDEFDWGLRLSTGSFPDNISTNQTLTDFFNRKPFALDQAFITYKPKSLPGLRLQGGKFEPPWNFTEMTFDNGLWSPA